MPSKSVIQWKLIRIDIQDRVPNLSDAQLNVLTDIVFEHKYGPEPKWYQPILDVVGINLILAFIFWLGRATG